MVTHIEDTIRSIERSLGGKLGADGLSSESFVSRRQLYRDFYSHSGHSVSEYIRKRKLSKALGLLKFSRMSFSEIAYSCGYSSVQALCRSVKSSLDMTPTEYRRSSDIYYFPSLEGGAERRVSVSGVEIPKTIRVKYFHTRLTGIENRAVSYLLEVLPGFSGRLFGRNEEQAGSRFRYDLYIEFDEANVGKLSEAFGGAEICPGYTALFASVSADGSEREINAAWDYLYGSWLKSSMFEQDETPYFDEYKVTGGAVKKLILRLPVRQRKNFYKINIARFEERRFIAASGDGADAEKTASAAVVDFASEHHPHLLRRQKEFFISRNGGLCVCGMSADGEISLPPVSGVRMLAIPKGLYAVLEGSCFGSGGEYERILLGWLRDNGFETQGDSFSVYDTSKGTKQNEITVKSQVQIKDGTI